VERTATADDHALVTGTHPVHVYVHVAVVAAVGAVAVLLWLAIYEAANRLLWENGFITANPWAFPLVCMPFSLAVGLLVKHRHAPTNLDESLIDSLAGDPAKIDWRTLPVNVAQAWASLLSGAVLGPEGGIGGIASKVAMLYADKLHLPAAVRSRLIFSTVAAAYNGLVASPLFTGVLGTELVRDPDARGRTLPANLMGGAIGYLVFVSIGSAGLQDYLHLGGESSLTPLNAGLVIACGLLGMGLAVIAGAMFRAAAAGFGRLAGHEVERALLAGAVFSVVGMVAPIVLFSGETQILVVVADPAAYGAVVLVVMALAKLALLAVAFKSGFLGGPTFPAIFASTCVALAISLVLPGLPVAVIVGGIMAGFLMVLFKAPFMVIVLTSIMLGAGPDLTALVVLAVAEVMIIQPYLMAAIGRRRGSAPSAGAVPDAAAGGAAREEGSRP
jgi:H+/Cl- antiporter ClcA